MHPTIAAARMRVIDQKLPADRQLLDALVQLPESEVPDLLALADEVRTTHCGNGIAVEVLYNAKKGGCSEDCHFCSQSARFASDVEPDRSRASKVSSKQRAMRTRAVPASFASSSRCAAHRPNCSSACARPCASSKPSCRSKSRSRWVSCAKIKSWRLVEAGVDKVNHNLETSQPLLPVGLHDAHVRRTDGDAAARPRGRSRALLRRHHRHGRNDRRSRSISVHAAEHLARRGADKLS